MIAINAESGRLYSVSLDYDEAAGILADRSEPTHLEQHSAPAGSVGAELRSGWLRA